MGITDYIKGMLPQNNPLDGGLQKFSPALYQTLNSPPPDITAQGQARPVQAPAAPSIVSPSGYDAHSTYEYLAQNPAVMSAVARHLGLGSYDTKEGHEFLSAKVAGLLSNPKSLEYVGSYVDKNFPVQLAQPDNTPVKLATPSPLPQARLITPAPVGKGPNFSDY